MKRITASMDLEDYINRLPDDHQAKKEYWDLKTEVTKCRQDVHIIKIAKACSDRRGRELNEKLDERNNEIGVLRERLRRDNDWLRDKVKHLQSALQTIIHHHGGGLAHVVEVAKRALREDE